MDSNYIPTIQYLKASLWKGRSMVGDAEFRQKEKFTKGHSPTIACMERVCSNGLIRDSTMVCSQVARKTVRAFIIGPTVKYTKESSKMTNVQEWEPSTTQMARNTQVCGKKAKNTVKGTMSGQTVPSIIYSTRTALRESKWVNLMVHLYLQTN